MDATPPRTDSMHGAPAPPGGSWMLVLGAVLVLVVLSRFPKVESPFDPAAPATFASLAAAPTLADWVPGWLDAVVIVVDGGASGDRHLVIWEPWQAAPELTVIPGSDAVAFDVSGRWVASSELAGGVVYAGAVGDALEQQAEGAGGFAWHDTEPGLLAWSTPGSGPTLGAVMLADLGAGTASDLTAGVDASIRRWGDWGFAMSAGSEARTELRDPEGAFVEFVDGAPLGLMPGGLGFSRVPTDDSAVGAFLRTPGGVATAKPVGLIAGEYLRRVAVNEQRPLLAYHIGEGATSEGGLVRVVTRSGSVVVELGTDVAALLTWSRSGRHLVIGTSRGGQPSLRIYDVETGSLVDLAIGFDTGPAAIRALAVQDR